MSASAHAEWRSMLATHTKVISEQLRILRDQLQPLLAPTSDGDSVSEIKITNDTDMTYAVTRLFEWTSAGDEAVGQSFRVSADPEIVTAPIRAVPYHQLLNRTMQLAKQIQEVSKGNE